MTDLRDGFLYHPDGETETDQLRRLVAGEHNLVLDNLFSATLVEADEAISKVEDDHCKAVAQLERLQEKIESLALEIEDKKAQKIEVASAIQRFHKTGELDEILIPAADKLLTSERRKFDAVDAPKKQIEIEEAREWVAEKICGEKWDVSDAYADDEFVYVTVKRLRAKPPKAPRPTRERLVDKIRQAFEDFGAEFRDRIKPANLASVTTARPRAP